MLWAPFVLIDNKGVNHNILINWHKNLHLHADHHFSCKKLGRKNNTLPHLLRFSSALSLGLVFVAESQSSLEKNFNASFRGVWGTWRKWIFLRQTDGCWPWLIFFGGLDEILRRFFFDPRPFDLFFSINFSLNVSHSGPFFFSVATRKFQLLDHCLPTHYQRLPLLYEQLRSSRLESPYFLFHLFYFVTTTWMVMSLWFFDSE